jgi:hypothetical protein
MDLGKSFAAAAATAVEKDKEIKIPAPISGFLSAIEAENGKEGVTPLRISYGAFTALLVEEKVLPEAAARVAIASVPYVQALETNLQKLVVDSKGKCSKWDVPTTIALVKDGTKLLPIYREWKEKETPTDKGV